MNKLEESLSKIAKTISGMDEASLSSLLEKYKNKARNFSASAAWEKDFIIFSIINAVCIKNSIFNEQILKNNSPASRPGKPARAAKPDLKLVK